ncbi:hypothetical protein OAP05_02495 [Schleiferiaceae bacterium]|nr:hypothetical protein [Schleiferiaceae bacterium]
MKLLTTIAAVLISISAFSQDYVEYNEGTFTQNGEELSMEQIYDLTELHKSGGGNILRANRFNLMYKSSYLRGTNNTFNFVSGAANGPAGGFLVFFGGLLIYWSPGLGIPMTAAGTGLCVVSYKAFSMIALSPEACLRKRDNQFNKVADKLNEAIKAANQ